MGRALRPGALGLDPDEAGLLNDDRVGRALDQRFDCDRGSLLTELMLGVIAEFAVDCSQLHNDSTSISLRTSRSSPAPTPAVRPHAFAAALRERKLRFSLGYAVSERVGQAALDLAKRRWKPALDASGEPREGAWVAEFERHEAPSIRMEVEDQQRRIVAAVR